MKSTWQLKVALQPPHVSIEYILFFPKSPKNRFLVKNQRPNLQTVFGRPSVVFNKAYDMVK